MDFTKYDRLDFRSFDANLTAPKRQKLDFLGNFASELASQKVGSAYFNRTSDKLVFETNGDGVADHWLTVKGVSTLKASYFLL